MAIKNILVSYNGTPGATAALGLALLMAEKYDAHVTGVLTHGPRSSLRSYANHIPSAALEAIEQADEDHRKQIADQFHINANAKIDPSRVHYLDQYGDADLSLMEVARTFDLIVMPQEQKDENYTHMQAHPDVVARGAGRPVLVVPVNYSVDKLAERSIMAWDGRRTAARALADAMNILEANHRLSLLTIGDKTLSETQSRAIVNQLERHGIFSEFINVPKSKTIARTILDSCTQKDAGLLVMGAYEHAKIAEDLFGGVTNTILKEATIPVLMSH